MSLFFSINLDDGTIRKSISKKIMTNTYVTFLNTKDQEVFDEYVAQEVIYKLQKFGICPPELIYDDCSYDESFLKKALLLQDELPEK